MNGKIKYWDRAKQSFDYEMIYGDSFVRFAYDTKLGRFLSDKILSYAFFSKIFGWYQHTFLSSFKIKKDIKIYNIPMDLFEDAKYKNYSDFFLRKYKTYNFSLEENNLPAFAEGKYLGFEKIDDSILFPVKGKFLNIKELVKNDDISLKFKDGPLMICRLCPTDYHHFHFPDDGKLLSEYRVSGKYYSVNLMALRKKEKIFLENERHISLLRTKNFGDLLYIEVGAICVGKIIQTFTKKDFNRGDLKGHFDFGASTVILIGEKDKFKISEDILKNTKNKIETKIMLGDVIAKKKVEAQG